MKKERLAAYIRVSTQEQKIHGLSLDAQKDKLKEYAEKNGHNIVEWYMDEGVSARKLIKKRPELQRMIVDAEAGKFDRIIFIRLDRFFRSVAEYHECMKRISPVVWTTTEEEYDLTTANGRLLVNMKLTIAELEADQTGERIRLVNEYKVKNGQPLTGSVPFCYAIVSEGKTKKIVKNPETAEIMDEIISHFLKYQAVQTTLKYINDKYDIVKFSHEKLSRLLKNPMICGDYRGNHNYCEPYVDKETFNLMQTILKKNIRCGTKHDYIFTGLIRCPKCGRLLKGSTTGGSKCTYKVYRCTYNLMHINCNFNKIVYERTLEKLMIANVEKYFDREKVKLLEVENAEKISNPKYRIEDLQAEIDRLNYAWQKGRIKSVVDYDKQYDALVAKLEAAQAERAETPERDFAAVETALQGGWKIMYAALDDERKRAFWRSFVKSIDIDWSVNGHGQKKLVGVNFL